MKYCNECKEKYGLNDRTFQLFNTKCEICNKLTYVNFCTETKIENGYVHFKKVEQKEINNKRIQEIVDCSVKIGE